MKVQEKNITKTKTKRIINESSRKNITKTKTKRIISESSRKQNITKTIRCGGGGTPSNNRWMVHLYY